MENFLKNLFSLQGLWWWYILFKTIPKNRKVIMKGYSQWSARVTSFNMPPAEYIRTWYLMTKVSTNHSDPIHFLVFMKILTVGISFWDKCRDSFRKRQSKILWRPFTLSGLFYHSAWESLTWVDSSTTILWNSLFPKAGCLVRFLLLLFLQFYRTPYISCKQCRTWLDTVFSGFRSGSALFAKCPFVGFVTKRVKEAHEFV